MTVSETMIERALKAAPRFWQDTANCEKHMRAALTAALSDRVVVPKEPTREMKNEFLRVAAEGHYASGEGFEPSYRAMIAAAPASTAGEVE